MSLSSSKKKKFDLDRIAKSCGFDAHIVDNMDIIVEELEKIFIDFVDHESDFEKAKANILTVLNNNLQRQVPFHKSQNKGSDHLIGKIIRNINENPDKYSNITVENYNKLITDLIGVRIIILNKHDWKDIHQELLEIFNNRPERYAKKPTDLEKFFDEYIDDNESSLQDLLKGSYHAEEPVVYATSQADWQEYKVPFLRIDNSREQYRSIHYIIRYGDFHFEIQVRTLFEEGWLEFDHRVKYPNDRNNPKKKEYMAILNSLAIAADRLIAFYREDDFKHKTPKAKAMDNGAIAGNTTLEEPKTIADKIKHRY